jgi:site-specific recombinase XerD
MCFAYYLSTRRRSVALHHRHMRVSYRVHRSKEKNGQLKKTPCPILVSAYTKETGRIEIATGETIIPKHWNGSRANTKAPDFDRLNDNLSRIERELTQLWRDNLSDLSKLREKMPAIVRGVSSSNQKKRIFEALESFLTQYKTDKEAKTLGKYLTLQTRLTDFDRIYPIDFDSLDYNFYDRFKKYLYGHPNPNYSNYSLYPSTDKDHFLLCNDNRGLPVGLFDDTVFKYFINLKTFLSWASKRGHEVHPSYKTWEIIKRKHEPISLTLEELERLESTPMPSRSLEIARGYLAFECRTGQRISDIKRFDQRDYVDYKWTHRPKKGNRLSAKTVTVHFKGYSAPALFILGRYNFKMPQVSEQSLNENIKKACAIAKIDQEIYTDRWAGNKKVRITGKKYEFLSTHTGRRSFITIALSQGMPVEIVMELTGISEYQTIRHYKAKFEDSSIEKYLNGITDAQTFMKKAN